MAIILLATADLLDAASIRDTIVVDLLIAIVVVRTGVIFTVPSEVVAAAELVFAPAAGTSRD